MWGSPDRTKVLEDALVRMVPTDLARDGEALWKAASFDTNGEDLFRWSLGTGPFADRESFLVSLGQKLARSHDLIYTVIDVASGQAVGSLTLLNLRPEHGSLEVGSIWYAKKFQRTGVNTHCLFLVMKEVFESLGYRRLEWKCNHENLPSRRAAHRLGFRFEGTFRQHFWDKGKNRDTDWFAIVDGDWPALKARFESSLLLGPSPRSDRPLLRDRTYLPLYYDLTGKRVVIVGGGKAAWQKVRALSPFRPLVTVISPAFATELVEAAEGTELTLVARPWDEADLAAHSSSVPIGLVLACTDDHRINDRIVEVARKQGLPVLDASRPEAGDFIQPAALKSGTFTLAVSSGGAGPRLAVAVRDSVAAFFESAVETVSTAASS